jgi:integrase
MTHAKKRWSYCTGERGRNRVRAFEHSLTASLFLEFAEDGARKRVALGHRDREVARAKAEELAAALRRGDTPVQLAAPTVATLFDNYVREVTTQKSDSSQRHDRWAVKLFVEFLGPSRKAASLNRRDWDGYIRWRRSKGDGRKGRAKQRPVRNRIIECDLKFLSAVLNWAVAAGLLERNPLKGLSTPKEEAPRRPILTHGQYLSLLAVARTVDPLFDLALALAHETGHRIGSIRLLRWSGVDRERGVMRWRAENDKIGFEHETILTPEALAALDRARAQRPAIGDSWLLPAPGDSGQPCSRHLMRDWWRRAEALAEIKHEPGLGWHALRRKFATELKQVPLKDLCQLGGWKEPQTVLKCYQKPDEATMREALASRRQLHAAGESTQ